MKKDRFRLYQPHAKFTVQPTNQAEFWHIGVVICVKKKEKIVVHDMAPSPDHPDIFRVTLDIEDKYSSRPNPYKESRAKTRFNGRRLDVYNLNFEIDLKGGRFESLEVYIHDHPGYKREGSDVKIQDPGHIVAIQPPS